MPGSSSSPIVATAPATDPPGRPSEDAVDGRTLHYGAFYGVDALPDDDGRPLVVVVGNCQAESLRVLLDATGAVRSVRVPPVFEIAADEMPLLHRVLARADVLLGQPTRDDYRDLPLGTAQLAAATSGRVVRFPAIRYAGLHPYQVVLRVPGETDPPPVPYHDLRTLLEAAGHPRKALSRKGVREIAEESIMVLREREERHGSVPVHDLLAPAGVQAAHVVNHPGNPVLVGLAQRVADTLGLDVEVRDPGRTLLDAVHAPLLPEVVDALTLDAEPRPHWVHHGAALPDEQVRETQLAWLAERPHVVRHGLERHAATITALEIA